MILPTYARRVTPIPRRWRMPNPVAWVRFQDRAPRTSQILGAGFHVGNRYVLCLQTVPACTMGDSVRAVGIETEIRRCNCYKLLQLTSVHSSAFVIQ